ncbi:CCA tRNA nucleotidyltransferase [Vibrio phage vB_VmeM-Yong XC32]|nr:CCA tRNA nucleotidyltransferase [Vibrio phage vB_VmeM-Yong XC31]QAX96586.1 CCA tRNA nucleotidyltransferase [Vibrio phage vB_VmeM-Yong XC32]QAX96904.1 CCA tRNA nucleotidyltransferase [Vibrio phage vB_VmeM-Yong MS31]QAX97209.1 CCA tRNA nucleotidyltransferase [Vibrio phage vB_VmeM-Yong MS32]
MEKYIVGGWCRNKLMRLEPKDVDYVVINETPTSMVRQGFIQIGKDFPVFMDAYGDEHALARTDKKEGVGHTGFDCNWEGVTLEEDLLRRDFTINAIAYDEEKEEFIDPHGFIKDVEQRMLRPIGKHFHEDPLRVLRAARFLALYDLEPTAELYRECRIASEHLEEVSRERWWRELEKVIVHGGSISTFFKFLSDVGAYGLWGEYEDTPQNLEHHPEGNVANHTRLVTDYAAKVFGCPKVTLAAFLHDIGKPSCYRERGNAYGHAEVGLPLIEKFCDDWKVPSQYRKLALVACKNHTKIHQSTTKGSQITKKKLLEIIREHRAVQNPRLLAGTMAVCISDARGRGHKREEIAEFESKRYEQVYLFFEAVEQLKGVDSKSIAENCANKKSVPDLIHKAQLQACNHILRHKVLNTATNEVDFVRKYLRG